MKTATEIGNAMLQAKKRRMSRDEALTLGQLLIASEMGALDEDSAEAKWPTGARIAKAKLEWAGVPTTAGLCWAISAMSDRPGTVVLYCAAVKAIHDNVQRKVTIDDFFKNDSAFADGFVADTEVERIWDTQKVHDGKGPDNWLDRKEAWTQSA